MTELSQLALLLSIMSGAILRYFMFSDSVNVSRAMAYDEEFYPDPTTFNPERFLSLDTNENLKVHPLNTFRPNDPTSLIFGFGRR